MSMEIQEKIEKKGEYDEYAQVYENVFKILTKIIRNLEFGAEQ